MIAALQDFEASKGRPVKSYPANWGGIIAAIQNMTDAQFQPGSSTDTTPGTGTIDPNTGEWIETSPPPQGTLWFDTRQGRLFVYVSGSWVQTNGGDGFPTITASSTAPTFPGGIPAPGQFWFDAVSGSLYIHDGQFIDGSGNTVPVDDPNAVALWRLINSVSSASFNTGTLVNNGSFSDDTYNFVAALVSANFVNQDDINQWLVAAVDALDTEAGQTDVIALTEPGTPVEGEVWFDATNQIVKVYESGAWKACYTPEVVAADVSALTTSIATEVTNRTSALSTLSNTITASLATHTTDITALDSDVTSLEATVNAVPTTYATKAETAALQTNLETQISNVTVAPPDLSGYATVVSLNSLQAVVNNLPTQASINSVTANIPDVSNFVQQSHIDYTVNQSLNSYMPLGGGTFTNGISINRSSGYGIDLGGSATYSQQALRLTSNNPTGGSYATFGANDQYWELAWDLDTKEDLCVRAGASDEKVFSINENGVACENLFIGDFLTNTTDGRSMHNTIDVRSVITQLQTDVAAISQIQSDVLALDQENDIHYSDNAPTSSSDGDIWFDSTTLRLYVQHGGAWIYPDRVEDTVLKTSLLNAVNSSADYASLKANLITALS